MKIFIILLLLLLSACSFELKIWNPQLNNVVSFSSDFSEEEKEVVLSGLNIWTRDTNGAVSFIEGKDPNLTIIKGTEEQAIKRDDIANQHLAPNENKHITLGYSITSSGMIYLFYGRLPNDNWIKQVAAHEGGHQIGMTHIPQSEGALMNADIDFNLLQNLHLTKYDLIQFEQFWGVKEY